MTTNRRRTPRVIRIEVGPRNTSYLHGAGLVPILDKLGVPHMRCPYRRVLSCPSNRLDDVLAYLDHRDSPVVELVAVDR
ncbi:hypothetical protein [Geodermatophilus sp. SYSU D01176]